MKTTTKNYSAGIIDQGVSIIATLVLLLITHGVNAQIPQNIEVKGEPSDIVSYIYYALALVVFVVLILILGKFFRRKK